MDKRKYVNDIKKANRELEYARKHNLTNDKIETAKFILEKSGLMKDGRITYKTTLNPQQTQLVINTVKNLTKNRLSSITKPTKEVKKIMRENNLKTKQELLGFYDIMNRTKTDRLISKMLSSYQVQEMYQIGVEKGLTSKQVEMIIKEELQAEARKQISEKGYIEPNDQVAILIRKRLYDL